MASIGLELHLEERRDDRVVVSLCVAPEEGDEVFIDGATLRLVLPDGVDAAPRLLLPLAGAIRGPIATTVELRAPRALPEGCEVVAVAWFGCEQRQLRIPADPFRRLRDHVSGADPVVPAPLAGEEPPLQALTLEEEEALERRFPWIFQPIRAPEPAPAVIEVREEPEVERFCKDHGLDDGCASWLKDLLEEG